MISMPALMDRQRFQIRRDGARLGLVCGEDRKSVPQCSGTGNPKCCQYIDRPGPEVWL